MAERLFDPNRGASDVLANPIDGTDPMEFNAAGIGEVDDVTELSRYLGMSEPGLPGLHYLAAVQGDATTTITVPAGKYWRLIGVNILLITDASAGNRTVTILTQDSADAAIESLVHANVAASQTIGLHALYGSEAWTVGNLGVAAGGTLTLPTIPVAADTMTLEGTVFTFVADGGLTGAINEISIGANVAATQANIEAALGTVPAAGAHSVSDSVRAAIAMSFGDFAADVSIITAAVEGTDGNGHTLAETFTPGDGVFDAATLGTGTAGVDDALLKSAEDYPEDFGALLLPGEDIVITEPGLADTGDDLYIFVSYVEYNIDPNAGTGVGAN